MIDPNARLASTKVLDFPTGACDLHSTKELLEYGGGYSDNFHIIDVLMVAWTGQVITTLQ